MRQCWLALALALAGCSGAESWTKPGTEAVVAAREYQDCRDLAAAAVKTDADIDQDILATRQDDRQRATVFRLQNETNREHTKDRAAAIVDSCMRSKGFAAPR